jgi:SAM-dependent methyltransferase
MSKTDDAWKKWGETDPYYGVLSAPEFRSENLTPETLAKFFASGDDHIDRVLGTIRSTIAPDFFPEVALDYGCGTGRLALPLARRCRAVFAIDISPAMLDETRKNCASAGITNVQTFEPAEALGRIDGIDLIHSYIVFQHIPVKTGMKIIRELVGALAPGGCIALHVTYARSAGVAIRLANWARHNIPGGHAALQMAQGRPIGDAPMQMNHYPLNRLLQFLQDSGFERLHLELTNHHGHLGAMIYGQREQDRTLRATNPDH